MMGSGKTAVGRSLARLMGIHFTDIDHMIVESAGKSINRIFEEEGEPYFRQLETDTLKVAAGHKQQVVSTGGGIILNPANGELMKSTGTVVFLDASLDTLWERVQLKSDRPLLKTAAPRATLEAIYAQRQQLYRQYADEIVKSEGKSFHDVARDVMARCVKHR